MRIYRDFKFDAAHFLGFLPLDHKCHYLHGHTYRLRVEVRMLSRESLGNWIMDFAELDEVVDDQILKEFDHSCLNDIIDVPTCENLASKFMDLLEEAFPHNFEYRLTLSEGGDSGVVSEWRQSKKKS